VDLIVASVALPGLIVGAFVLWFSTKVLRFRDPSFWTSLRSMTIAVGVSIIGVLVMPILSFWVIIGAALGLLAAVGVISIALLFREPLWKTLAAIGLVVVGEALFLATSLAIVSDLLIRGLRDSPFR